MRNIEIGTPVRMDPSKWLSTPADGGKRQTVPGRIVYINRAHRWFLVEWGPGLRNGFKFDDIGGEVTVYG